MKKCIGIMFSACVLMLAMALLVTALEGGYVYKPDVGSKYVQGVPAGATLVDVRTVMPQKSVDIYSSRTGKAYKPGDGASVCTGDTIVINGERRILVVAGDVNCDGRLGAADYILVKRLCMGTFSFEGFDVDVDACRLAAGDSDLDGSIGASEYIKIRRACMGTFDLLSEYIVPASDLIESGWGDKWV